MGEKNVNNLFPKFYPFCKVLCDQTMKEHMPELFPKFRELVFKSPDEELEILHDHLMFPFEVYLQEPWLSENYTIEVMKFIASYEKRVSLQSVQFLSKTIERILKLAFNPDGNKKISEDFKLETCELLTVLLNSSTKETLVKFYADDKSKFVLSQLVFETLKWMDEDKKIIRLFDKCSYLLQTLCSTTTPTSSFSCHQLNLETHFCNVFSQMLPGITSKLIRLVQDGSLGLKAKAWVVKLWTIFVTKLVCDRNFEFNYDCDDKLEGEGKVKFRWDQKWLDLTRDHLSNHYKVMSSFAFSVSSTDPSLTPTSILKVRTELLNCVQSLVQNASSALNNLFYDHVDILCVLIAANLGESLLEKELTEKANDQLDLVLEKIKLSQVGDGNLALNLNAVVSKAHDNVFECCQALKRPSRFQVEKIASNLNRLHGYLSLLIKVEDVSHFFLSQTYVNELTEALKALLKLDMERQSLTPEENNIDRKDFQFIFEPELFLDLKRPRKDFFFLNSAHLIGRYRAIVGILIRLENLDILFERILADNKMESLILLSDILLLLSEERQTTKKEVEAGKSCFLLLQSSLDKFLLLLERSEDDRTSLVPLNQNKAPGVANTTHNKNNTQNWSIKLIVIEALGRIALASKSFSWPDFKGYFLGKCLSLTLSNLDVGSYNESRILYHALNDMREGCNFTTVEELLLGNLDYLTMDLNLILRRYQLVHRSMHNKGVATLLKLILRLRNISECSGLRETLNALLTNLDLSWLDPDREITTELLRIILVFVESLALEEEEDPSPEIEVNANKDQFSPENLEGKGSICKFVLDLKKVDNLLDKEDDVIIPLENCPKDGFHKKEEENCEDDFSQKDDEETKKEISERVEMLRDVLDHTRHFVSMVKCPEWQIIALDIVSKASALMKPEQDELLPLIHLCWQPLKLLFTSDNIFIVEKSFQVLQVFSLCAGDFIRQRTLADVFPAILKYIKRLQVVLQDGSRRHTLLARQARKMLKEMFRGLFKFMDLLDLDEQEVEAILAELLQFATFCKEKNNCLEGEKLSFVPKRRMDKDMLWLLTGGHETVEIYC